MDAVCGAVQQKEPLAVVDPADSGSDWACALPFDAITVVNIQDYDGFCSLFCGWFGGVWDFQTVEIGWARRPAATGVWLPPGGLSSQDAPPIVVVAKSAQLRFRLRRKLRPLPCSSSPHRAGRGGGPFRSCPKRKRAVHGPKRKALARSGAVALRADGSRRIGASADLDLSSGTLYSSTRWILLTRGEWR